MGDRIIVKKRVLEGTDFSMMFRPVGDNGAIIYKSGISSATFSVYDLSSATPDVAIYSPSVPDLEGPLVQAFNTLQTDGYWDDEDPIGYTVRARLDVSEVSDPPGWQGGKRYRIEIILSTNAFGPVPLVSLVQVQGLSRY